MIVEVDVVIATVPTPKAPQRTGKPATAKPKATTGATVTSGTTKVTSSKLPDYKVPPAGTTSTRHHGGVDVDVEFESGPGDAILLVFALIAAGFVIFAVLTVARMFRR